VAAVAKYIADTSALARLQQPAMAERLAPLIMRGLVGTCALLDFEILFSARTPADYAEAAKTRRASFEWLSTEFEWLSTEDVDMRRGLEVQGVLATRSQHRISFHDLIIAAVAERHRVTVLHYDADYDLIAEITGQPTQWAVPRGTVP
jgi:predicted nucleic acid-binding protein